VSYFNFRNSLIPDEDTSGSVASLPQIPKSPNRVQSMFMVNNIPSMLNEWTRSQDTIENSINRPTVEVIDYSESTPISSKKFPLSNGTVNNKDKTLPSCKGCLDLMKQISALKDEVEYLRNKLTDSKKLQPEKMDDFSDILEHFNCNKF